MAFPYPIVECAFNNGADETLYATQGWTEITPWVISMSGPLRGRSNEVENPEAGTLTVVLDNTDGEFTPGNPASPFYPNIKAARRFRVRGKNMLAPNLARGGAADQSAVFFETPAFPGQSSSYTKGVSAPVWVPHDPAAYPGLPPELTGHIEVTVNPSADGGTTGYRRILSWVVPVEVGVRLTHSAFVWKVKGNEPAVTGPTGHRFELWYLDNDDQDIFGLYGVKLTRPMEEYFTATRSTPTRKTFSHAPVGTVKYAMVTWAIQFENVTSGPVTYAITGLQTELQANLAPNPNADWDALHWLGRGGTEEAEAPRWGTNYLQWQWRDSQSLYQTIPHLTPGKTYAATAQVALPAGHPPIMLTADGGQTGAIASKSPDGTDGFNRTVAAGGWGTSDSGHSWTVTGTASRYQVSGSNGWHRHDSVNNSAFSILSGLSDAQDWDISVDFMLPALPVGSIVEINAGISFAPGGTSNVNAQAVINPDGWIDIAVNKVVAGTVTPIGTVTGVATLTPGVFQRLRFQRLGNRLRGWVGPTDRSADGFWQATVNDSSFAQAGTAFVRSRLNTGATNTLPFSIQFDNFSATKFTWATVRTSFVAVTPEQPVEFMVPPDALFADNFNRVTAPGDIGTSDTGSAYTTSGGAAANYWVDGDKLNIQATSLGAEYTVIPTALASVSDFDISLMVQSPDMTPDAANNNPAFKLFARYIDGNNYLMARVWLTTSNTITLSLNQRIGGGAETVSTFPAIASGINSTVRIRFQGAGNRVRVKGWVDGDPEPEDWAHTTVTSLVSGGVRFAGNMPAAYSGTMPKTWQVDDLVVSNPSPAGVELVVRGLNVQQVDDPATTIRPEDAAPGVYSYDVRDAGAGNLLPNPDFEANVTGWITYGCSSPVRSSAQAATGTYSARVVPTGTDSFPRVENIEVPIDPTKPIYASGWMRADTDKYLPQIAIHLFDSSNNYLITYGHRSIPARAGSWVYLETEVPNPGAVAGAAKARVALGYADAMAAGAADGFYIDDARIFQSKAMAWERPMDIFEGWVESWPWLVDSSETQVTVVDRLKRVGVIELSNVAQETLLQDEPGILIPFNDDPVNNNGSVTAIGTWAENADLTSLPITSTKGDLLTSKYELGVEGPTDEPAILWTPANPASVGYNLRIPFSADYYTTLPVPPPAPPSTPPPPGAKKSYTKTYYATWSRSYDSDGSVRWDDSPYLYHGCYFCSNNQRALVGFNWSQIKSDLSGADIVSIYYTMKNAHARWNKGLDTSIGYHNYSSKPSKWASGSVTPNKWKVFFKEMEKKSVNLGTTVGNGFKGGTIKGIMVGPAPSNITDNYGYFYGATHATANKPYLTITYKK